MKKQKQCSFFLAAMMLVVIFATPTAEYSATKEKMNPISKKAVKPKELSGGDPTTAQGVLGGRISYRIVRESITITGCETSVTSVAIGQSIAGYPVRSIGAWAFTGCRSLTTVTIPAGVTSIGEDAFVGCSNLTTVTIPSSVKSIGAWAFSDCGALKGIVIPSGVIDIGNQAFSWCGKLMSISVEEANGNYSAENGVLFNKAKTKLLTYPAGKAGPYVIPDGVTCIGEEAFEGCNDLTAISIPHSMRSIGAGAFFDCIGLVDITMPNSVTSIGTWAFFNCSSLTSVTIPDSVTSIGAWAFSNCSSLTAVTIPHSVTSIGTRAFSDCDGLKSIVVEDSNLNYSTEDGVLFNKAKTKLILCPAGKEGNYTIPDRVLSIENEAFRTCRKLTSVKISDGVGSIGAWAFYGCSRLALVTIPNSVVSIGQSAFFHCYALTAIAVQDSSANYSEKDGVLFNKEKTELILCPAGKKDSYVIPDGVISIASEAFSTCRDLISVIVPNNVTDIGKDAFSDCNSALVLYGKIGSYAEIYAKCNKLAFSPIVVPKLFAKKEERIPVPTAFKVKPGKKRLTVTWKQVSVATGYKLILATNRNFTKGKKSILISRNTITKKYIHKLTKGKTYYVKLCAYRRTGENSIYSDYTKVKKSKIKK